MQRRTLLKRVLGSASLSFAGLPGMAQSSVQDEKTRLLVIMARGAMDGLTAVPPVGDPLLANMRRGISIQRPLPLTADFGLHPVMQNLHGLWGQGQLKIVHSTGFAYTGRSHFEGQDVMQSGVMKPYANRSGWMGRALREARLQGGVAISIPMPLLLKGDELAETQFPNWMPPAERDSMEGATALWSSDAVLAPYVQSLRATGPVRPMMQAAQAEAEDPLRSYATLARLAAQRMQRPLGPRVAVVDISGGFDTHGLQGGDTGNHAARLREVDQIVGAFCQEMGDAWKHSLVVTLTEFGRTAAENGTNGTDHGVGSCCFLAGGLINSSGVIADWRGLAKDALFEQRDLPATIDACAVYAQVLERLFKLSPQVIQEKVLAHRPSPALSKLWV